MESVLIKFYKAKEMCAGVPFAWTCTVVWKAQRRASPAKEPPHGRAYAGQVRLGASFGLARASKSDMRSHLYLFENLQLAALQACST